VSARGARPGQALLAPLGAAFGAAAALRVALYRHAWLAGARLGGPVISVGNLSVGGNGKTPVVARLAALLREAGLPVAILSRGYGGSFRGEALIVSDGTRLDASAALAGDEPVLLARTLPGVIVAVGPRRDLVGRHVEARFGRVVHLLDDGFQHLRLQRDLDLLCVDALDAADRPMPAGRLREFPSASARADLVLLTRSDQAPPERLAALEARFGRERAFRVRRRIDGFADLDGRPADAPARAWLVSGIARPEVFEADVAARVGRVVGHAAFRDHHRFTREEIAAVTERARAAGAGTLVTTAKDAVRLPDIEPGLPWRVLRLAVEIEDEARLRERVLAVTAKAFAEAPAAGGRT
jgi:tetraacyldisaccharide 4'-kinase